MARQKKENRAVPESYRKVVTTCEEENREGGKAIPVNKQTWQLELCFEAAEESAGTGVDTDGEVAPHLRGATTYAVPKPKHKEERATLVTMEAVTSYLREAFQKVASNKGAAGPDRQSIIEVRKHLEELLPKLTQTLAEGNYEPGNIRRVWIPKWGGGKRGLGIPNVVDRMVGEAVRMVLEPLYEPTFHDQSHGFRPSRSSQTAIAQARKHVEDGYEWVVDLDLEKFFDRVNHQRLMARLAQRVKDRHILVLIGKMLKVKVEMPEGVVVRTEEGVSQGGPLSPLLSNIVLDELDTELERRGHRFVRYADDANIYVRSERAGQRVMASVTRFIERRLRLKVNAAKSAVARSHERHFLGFSLRREPMDGTVEVLLSKRTKERIDAKIRELTPRNWGNSIRACIRQLNEYLRGWINYFGICTEGIEKILQDLDKHIRRRLRAIQLKHWKRKRTIVQKLIHFGVLPKTAWRGIYEGRKSIWALSHSPAVDRGLRNANMAERGLVSIAEKWREHFKEVVASAQQSQQMLLALK